MSKECIYMYPCALEVLSWRKGPFRSNTRNVVKSSFPVQSLSSTNDHAQSSVLAKSDASLIFAAGTQVRECLACRPIMSQTFKIPDLWWAPFVDGESNGFFGYEDVVDDQGNRTAVITWARFTIRRIGGPSWTRLDVFSIFHISSLRTQIIIFDPHPIIAASPAEETPLPVTVLPRDSIISSIFDSITDAELADPFWFYPRMIHDIVRIQDFAVWETATFVRNIEMTRAFLDGFSTTKLQQIPRYVLDVSETLCVAEATLESIKHHHQHFLSTSSHPTSTSTSTSSPPSPNFTSLNIRNRLNFYHHMLTSLRHNSTSSISHIATEITLTYNEIAYKDAKLQRVDSTAMRAIAFVTLVFLPATFVSAIFGTGFFSYDAPTGIWGVSPKFWIFWAAAIPVTLLTMLGWLLWMKHFLQDGVDTSQQESQKESFASYWKGGAKY